LIVFGENGLKENALLLVAMDRKSASVPKTGWNVMAELVQGQQQKLKAAM